MKWNISCNWAIAALALLFPGCQSQQSSGKPVIALIMKSLANEFFLTMEKGAKDHHAKNAGDYELITNGIKDELDVSRQIDLVEQMIAQRVSAIVIAPADSKALVTVCKKAQDAGIVVINIDNKFDADVLAAQNVRIPFIGPDNRKGAKLAGDELAKKLKPGDPVAIVEGVPSAFNAQQRKLGFEDAARAANLKVANSQSAGWEMSKANQVVAAMIAEQPDIKGVLCANDSMALGAAAALKEAGKSDSVFVVGFDNISAVHQLVKDGKVLATVDQHGDQLAVFGIQYALEILRTKAAPADRETPVDLVTKETLK
ncbi:LacI family transcriptional regulator [Planctomycetaceae bacterium SCGC AG-212-F19]|nr:LacI family transcriptional regulator [Planctomycetaceae bacterium SCGC AG-212-F19]